MEKLIFGTGASASKVYMGLLQTVRAAVDGGIRAFDTAPSYHTEEVLGQILNQIMVEDGLDRGSFFIQSKIDAWQMQESNGDIRKYVQSTLKQMNLEYLDALLIHWPLPEYLEHTWRNFVKLYDAGIVRQIGICNVRMRQLNKFLYYDFMPQIIQIERNPLRTCDDEVAFCKEHDIVVQVYSPLCKMDERIRDSVILKNLAEKYRKSVGQIVLRWHLDTKVIPIFTSTNPNRIKEYTDLADFKLSEDEVTAISSLNINYKMYLESCACPGF